MTTLYAEVIVSILAAALIGLFVGWMISAARSRRLLQQAKTTWARKNAEVEKKHAADVDELEARLQSTGEDVRQLTEQKRSLESQLRQSGTGADQARSDAIELNHKQNALTDRLHRTIREREREIEALRSKLSPTEHRSDVVDAPQQVAAPVAEQEAYIDQISTRSGRQLHTEGGGVTAHESNELEDELEDDFDATVMLDKDALLGDTFDATEISPPELPTDPLSESMLDDSIDGYEDATLALDEEALARARNLR